MLLAIGVPYTDIKNGKGQTGAELMIIWNRIDLVAISAYRKKIYSRVGLVNFPNGFAGSGKVCKIYPWWGFVLDQRGVNKDARNRYGYKRLSIIFFILGLLSHLPRQQPRTWRDPPSTVLTSNAEAVGVYFVNHRCWMEPECTFRPMGRTLAHMTAYKIARTVAGPQSKRSQFQCQGYPWKWPPCT
ncbi:MAG: hypothetical protein R3A45_12395 [Bdellovibrionota bacterium]